MIPAAGPTCPSLPIGSFKGMTILNIQMLDTPGPNRSLN